MNEAINKFLENVKLMNYQQFEVADQLRNSVYEIFPNVKEEFKYGGILFSLTENFGGIYIYKSHVSFEFSYGYRLDDPNNELQGQGKYRRHLKFNKGDEVNISSLKNFLNQLKAF